MEGREQAVSAHCSHFPAPGSAPSLCAPKHLHRRRRESSRIARMRTWVCVAFGLALVLVLAQRWGAPERGAVRKRVALHELILSRVQGLREESQEEKMLEKVMQEARAEVSAEHARAQHQLERAETRNMSPVFPLGLRPAALAHAAAYDHRACAVVLDVRTEQEWRAGHISCAHFLPVQDAPAGWQAELLSLAGGDKNSAILTYCHSGVRAAEAATLIKKAGYSRVLNGGGYTISTNVTGITDRAALEKVCEACRDATKPTGPSGAPITGKLPLRALRNASLGRPMASPGYFESSGPVAAASAPIEDSNATEFEQADKIADPVFYPLHEGAPHRPKQLASLRSPVHNGSIPTKHSLNQQPPPLRSVTYVNRPLAHFVSSNGVAGVPVGARHHVHIHQMRGADAEVMLELGVIFWVAICVFATMASVTTVRQYLNQRAQLRALSLFEKDEAAGGQPHATPKRKHRPTSLGIRLYGSDINGDGETGLLVMVVQPGSIASAAGIHAGDRVLRIGGIRVEELPEEALAGLAQRELSEPTTIFIERRDGNREHVLLCEEEAESLTTTEREAIEQEIDKRILASELTAQTVAPQVAANTQMPNASSISGRKKHVAVSEAAVGSTAQEEAFYTARAYQTQDHAASPSHEPAHNLLLREEQVVPTGSIAKHHPSYGSTNTTVGSSRTYIDRVFEKAYGCGTSNSRLQSNVWPHLPVPDSAEVTRTPICCDGCLRIIERDTKSPAVRAAIAAIVTLSSVVIAWFLAPVAIVKAAAVLLSGVAASVMVSLLNNYMVGGMVRGAEGDTVKLQSDCKDEDDHYLDWLLTITDGCGSGQTRRISAYDGQTKTAVVSRPWGIMIDETSTYVLYADPWKNPISIFEHMSSQHQPLEAPNLTRRDIEDGKRNFEARPSPLVSDAQRIQEYVEVIEGATGSSSSYTLRREERRAAFTQRGGAKADDRHLNPPTGPPDTGTAQPFSRAGVSSSTDRASASGSAPRLPQSYHGQPAAAYLEALQQIGARTSQHELQEEGSAGPAERTHVV